MDTKLINSFVENKSELLPYKILSDILKDEQEILGNNDTSFLKQNNLHYDNSYLKSISILNTNLYGSIDYDESSYQLTSNRPFDVFVQNGFNLKELPISTPMYNIYDFRIPTKLTANTPPSKKPKTNLNEKSCGKCENENIGLNCQHCLNKILVFPKKLYSANKPYKCPECEFRCSSHGYLNIHMRIHTGENLYKCDLCSYSAPFKYSLNVHMRIHVGEKPYSCSVCDFRCSTKSYLETHMRIHTGETPYHCNICGYNTTFKYSLSVHMRTHLGNKPYQCNECSFKCSSESYFKKHMKSHSGEVYTCCICPYTSTSRSIVKLHTKHHMRQKPFQCTKCEDYTYKKTEFQKHTKTHL